MPDFKEMSFTILVILVAISALYGWVSVQPVIGTAAAVSGVPGYDAGTLGADLNSFSIAANSMITTSPLTDVIGYLSILYKFFSSVWGIIMKLGFGWTALLQGVFAPLGLDSIALVFTAPLLIIQIIGVLYFIRDIVNTIRGVG